MPVKHFGYPWKPAQNAIVEGSLDAMVTVPTQARLEYALSSKGIVYGVEMLPVTANQSEAYHGITAAPAPVTLKSLRVCDILGNGWGKRYWAGNGITPAIATKGYNRPSHDRRRDAPGGGRAQP